MMTKPPSPGRLLLPLAALLLAACISAWSPSLSTIRVAAPSVNKFGDRIGTPLAEGTRIRRTAHHDDVQHALAMEEDKPVPGSSKPARQIDAAAAGSFLLLATSLPAEAAGGGANPILSALVAYGHYLSLLVITGAVIVERVTVKPDMTLDEEKRLAAADIALGIAGIGIAVTGYLRVTEYGKGFDFYSHEPLFWLKILGVAVFGAASLFPTTKIVQRSIDQRNGKFEPMSEKLANRMTSILNAELLALASIPLFATLMARGVGYAEFIPWQIEAALVTIIFVGLGGKYAKEALDWKED